MDAVLMALDFTSISATLPDSEPLAPPGLGDAWNRIVGVGKWIALGVCVLGLLLIGGKMAFDARRGETTEEISSLIKVMLAVTLVSGGVTLIGFITGSGGGTA
jgi:hypothetical protein